ncbi:MAG: hypothetical protein A2X18_00650 [Bacteroidetes bacterium GWF2_40_14]|nr:MAG: hypothetical protein A2X18_00650 [Bacteroidetes bacterium GWF2_40_14]
MNIIEKSKQLLIYLLLFLLPLISCSVTHTVSGTIAGLANDTLYISLEASDSLGNQIYDTFITDTIVMKNNRFAFDIENGFFTMVRIIPAVGPAKILKSGMFSGYDSDYIILFVDKGEKVKIDANYDGKVVEYTLKGTPLAEKYSEYRNTLFEHQRKRADALREIGRLRSAGEPLVKGQAMLKVAMDSIRHIIAGFIDDNLNSPLTPYILLYNNMNDFDILISYKDKLRAEALKHPLAKEYLSYVKYAENSDEYKQEEMRKEKAFLELKGKQAPDFTLKTIDGKDITLSSFKGKYVVLDFWGSWCGWCLESMPKLLEYHKKYSQNIVIVAIACYDKESKWRKAVSDFKMDGLINVFDADNVVSNLYNITGYPTQVLITPEGIAEPFAADELYERLDQLFGNKH